MKLIAKQAFSWAHHGIDVEHFAVGAVIETSDEDLIQVATQQGWADLAAATDTETKMDAPALNKMADAPSTKAVTLNTRKVAAK